MTTVLKEIGASLVTRLTSNQLSTLRTIMSADRTLMAWVRTSLSLQSFGFTIYKVLQGFVVEGQVVSPTLPMRVGLVLSFASVLAMIMGILEYRHTLQMLDVERVLRLGRLTVLLALLISLTGVVLFIAIAARLV
ncbi:YidH family protein [Falsiroseomonas sp. HC035]|uniref:YidH family protein n=1 Tax=Falsiroseomonas sp. HC035 TaxID=3390999 RepID=UPI003D31E1B7